MNIQSYKNALKKTITGHEAGVNSFSQGGEDMMLRSIFRKKLNKKESGFYVDIGAYHPSYMSNTYLFYISGWTGINIDACPGSMKAFNKIRPKDINLEVGIGKKEELLTYYFIDEHSTMNSFSKKFLVETGVYESVKKEIPIKVYPLCHILEKYTTQFNKIDILNVDAEGLDLDIIKSNDWDKYRPSIIIIELMCTNVEDIMRNETAIYLSLVGYRIIAKNVITFNVASVFLLM